MYDLATHNRLYKQCTKVNSLHHTFWAAQLINAAYRSGCWWHWNLTTAPGNSKWNLLVQGAAPCAGFQVTHSVTGNGQQAADMTRMAVQLPDASRLWQRQKKEGNYRGEDAAESRQTWVMQLEASGVIMLWLQGRGMPRLRCEVQDSHWYTCT